MKVSTVTLTFNASPAVGHAPLDVKFSVSLVGHYLAGCSSGPSYDFGDGTKQVLITNSCAVNPVTPIPTPLPPYSYSYATGHRYERAGIYHAKLDWSVNKDIIIVVQ